MSVLFNSFVFMVRFQEVFYLNYLEKQNILKDVLMGFFHIVESHYSMFDCLRNFNVLLNVEFNSQLFKKLLSLFCKTALYTYFGTLFFFLKRKKVELIHTKQAWFGSEGTGLCSLIGKTYTPGLPKRRPGNTVLSFYRGDNDCAVACFHTVAYHRNADISCSPVFPVLISVAHNFTGFYDTELELPSPASTTPSGSFCCHKCKSCLVRSEFDCLAFPDRFFWISFGFTCGVSHM